MRDAFWSKCYIYIHSKTTMESDQESISSFADLGEELDEDELELQAIEEQEELEIASNDIIGMEDDEDIPQPTHELISKIKITYKF